MAKKKKKKKKTSRRTRTTVPKTFVLRVSLQWIEPEVWRTIAVRGDTTLGRLHDVLQAVVGWRHTHLHHFFSGDKRISDPRFELDAFQDDDPVLDENDMLLSDIVSKKGD
ncbi:MAG: plasmid pRiA4b ORF-3 family protein, partial [Myxococcota bacterium]